MPEPIYKTTIELCKNVYIMQSKTRIQCVCTTVSRVKSEQNFVLQATTVVQDSPCSCN